MISSIFYGQIRREDIAFLTVMINGWIDRHGIWQMRSATRRTVAFQAAPQSEEIDVDAIRKIP